MLFRGARKYVVMIVSVLLGVGEHGQRKDSLVDVHSPVIPRKNPPKSRNIGKAIFLNFCSQSLQRCRRETIFVPRQPLRLRLRKSTQR